MEKPIVIERIFDASINDLWRAITQKDLMKLWYFDLEEFKAEPGFIFEFKGLTEDCVEYIHICEVTDVIPEKKLTYSWKYKGYDGISFVTFELFEMGSKTNLVLTHSGIETFPRSNPDFAPHNFESGWNQLINISLNQFLLKTA